MATSDEHHREMVGGVDLGGTHVSCAIGRDPGTVVRRTRFSTRAPEDTLADVVAFFAQARREGVPISALGVSAFGPLDRDPASPRYGRLLTTPKPGWAGVDLLGPLRRLGVPIAIDTDVNGAALAEGRWGAARGLADFAYVTVGTGIGVGLVSGGRLVSGIGHPELGHYTPPKHAADDFAGCCPFHGACLEGLASGTALAARVQPRPPQQLDDDDPSLGFVAYYLAHLCSVILFATAPRRIVLGGGVMARTALLQDIRVQTRMRLAGYLPQVPYATTLDDVIVRSAWAGADETVSTAGVYGGFRLAAGAL